MWSFQALHTSLSLEKVSKSMSRKMPLRMKWSPEDLRMRSRGSMPGITLNCLYEIIAHRTTNLLLNKKSVWFGNVCEQCFWEHPTSLRFRMLGGKILFWVALGSSQTRLDSTRFSKGFLPTRMKFHAFWSRRSPQFIKELDSTRSLQTRLGSVQIIFGKIQFDSNSKKVDSTQP